MLYSLFSSKNHINISLPEPISFSDQVSNQQAYFLFQNIFSSFSTFEFYSESDIPPYIENDRFIFQARWSFRNKKNNNQYVYHIFFYLMNKGFSKTRASPNVSSEKNNHLENTWKITEIRAIKF